MSSKLGHRDLFSRSTALDFQNGRNLILLIFRNQLVFLHIMLHLDMYMYKNINLMKFGHSDLLSRRQKVTSVL